MRHTFPEIYNIQKNPEHAIALDDKNRHLIFEQIALFSKNANAKSGSLFSLNRLPDPLLSFSEFQLIEILKKLIYNRLVLQLFVFVFSEEDQRIRINPVFLSHSESQDIDVIYEELIEFSAGNIERYLSIYNKFDENALWSDINEDLLNHGKSDFQSISRDFIASVGISDFKIIPPSRLISLVIQDIKKVLVQREVLAEIPGYGIMAVYRQYRFSVFKLAERFMAENLLPQCQQDKQCLRNMRLLEMERTLYAEDVNNPESNRFGVKLADILRDHLLALHKVSSVQSFPGKLSLEILNAFGRLSEEDAAEEKYKRQVEEIIGIKEKLKAGGVALKDFILFMEERERRKYPEAVWNLFSKDPDLVYIHWYSDKTKYHCFAYKAKETFHILAELTQNLPRSHRGQALVMRKLADAAEADIPDLFKEKKFVKKYGNSLKGAYQDYFPWYVKLFMMLGFEFMQDMAFGLAKERIEHEQALARKEYKSLREAAEQQETRKRTDNMELITRVTQKNKVMAILDENLFRKKHFPTVQEIMQQLSPEVQKNFDDILDREMFQIVRDRAGSKKGEELALLLYPLDPEWKSNSRRIHNLINDIVEKDISKISNTELERVYLVRSFINQPQKQTTIPAPPQNEDPYKKLEREIKKKEMVSF